VKSDEKKIMKNNTQKIVQKKYISKKTFSIVEYLVDTLNQLNAFAY